MKRIVIAGGGISGLTLAYNLINENPDLQLNIFEADNRPGGKIWTDRTDGYLCEKGPNGFLDNKPMTLQLCRSLGIEPVRSNENAAKRFILSDNRLKPLPKSLLSFIRSDLLTWAGKFRLLFELNAPKGPPDETVADFILRRLGREALEKLIDPMCSGIYAGDPYKMSIKNCFPRIKELEQEYGSLIRALINIRKQKKRQALQCNAGCNPQNKEEVSVAPGGTLTSFYDGAQTITDTLAMKLGTHLKTGVSVHGISRDNGAYQVYTSASTVTADAVVIATPAYATANILRDFDAELSRTLSAIPYPHLSVVCFGYKREKVSHPLNGFGFLVPRIENRHILGSLWDSSIFPNRASEGHILLRTMIGGTRSPEIATMDNSRLTDIVFNELRSVVGLKTEPDMVRIYRWERAIPQYLLGHNKALNVIEKRLGDYPGLYLTGNAYRGIGINDCVENSYKLAQDIIRVCV